MGHKRLPEALALAGMTVGPSALAAPHYAAQVTRTAEGVAHVEARDMAGLGYGAGYSAAEDNGCVIAENRITVRGERARHFGAGNVTVGFNDIPNLESDFFHRIVGDLRALRRAHAATSRDSRALIAGFAAGYNRFLRDRPAGFAAECRGAAWLQPISSGDMLLMINAAAIQGSAAPYARFIAGAAPPKPGSVPVIPPTAPAPGPTVQQGLGSNAWAFGSERTATGGGMLVGVPHFPWSGPNRFRRVHLRIPGKLDVMGIALASSPFVTMGFNRDIAWAHTVSTSQHLSLFLLDLEPGDPTAHRVDRRREALRRRAITVEVKGAAPVTRTLYTSRYGPMIAIPGSGLPWSTTLAYALRDANQGNMRAGDAALGIARARSVRQIRGVLGRTMGIPYVNTIAADRAGDALFADISAVPNLSADKLDRCGIAQANRQDSDTPALFILFGGFSGCDWSIDRYAPVAGLMPVAQLPATIRTDYVQNSNDSYWLTNPAAPFPRLSPLLGLVGARQNLRTRASVGAVARTGRIDGAAARALALDNDVEAARLVLDDLLRLCPQRPALAAACTVLAKWDRRADATSRGALLFFAFWRKALGLKGLWATPFDPAQPLATPRGLDPAQASAILDALQGAVTEMAQTGLAPDAPLGQVQVSPRDGARIAIHGGPSAAGVLNAIHSARGTEGLIPFHGTSYAQVVGFDADGPVADSLLSYSQSSNPESPHYADGTRAYSEKRWLRLPFTPAQIEAARIGPTIALRE